MTKEEVLKQIALITGKKYEESNTNSSSIRDNGLSAINGSDTTAEHEFYDETSDDVIDDEDVSEVEDGNNDNGSERTTSVCSSIQQSTPDVSYSVEIKAYIELFGAKEVKNGKVLDGRTMTKKEYNKYTKGLSKIQLLQHPLLYKMFRSEDQMEGNFHSWCDKFGEENDN